MTEFSTIDSAIEMNDDQFKFKTRRNSLCNNLTTGGTMRIFPLLDMTAGEARPSWSRGRAKLKGFKLWNESKNGTLLYMV